MAGNTSAGAGESSAQDRSGSQDSGVSAPRGARTNQGSLIKEVLKNIAVEKFNGEGYDDWAWKMQHYFRQIGLLKLMIGEEPRPSDPALHEDWDERASAGYYMMSQSLELNQRHHVMHLLPEVDCGPKAWTVLKDLHAPTSVVATLMLERELSALRLSEGEPVQPVLDKMRDLYAKLATVGITYPEQTKCLKMLSLLPESWLQFTSGLSLPQNQSLWTLEWVRTKILEEDFRRRQLRGGEDGSSGTGCKRADAAEDVASVVLDAVQRRTTTPTTNKEVPVGVAVRNLDVGASRDGGARRNHKDGANMVADSSDNNPKSNGGAEKKKERTAGQFFHIGEQGEQEDASAKVGAELHPLDYWRVLRYLYSTPGMGLVLGGRARFVLTGYADASWVDDLTTQRSSQGYTFCVGSGSVSWRSTRSSSILSYSCEAEIYAGAMAAQELRWLTYLLTDLGEAPRSSPVLYVDNKAMLALCQEHRLEHRTKHIALRYFLAREYLQRGQLRLAYVTEDDRGRCRSCSTSRASTKNSSTNNSSTPRTSSFSSSTPRTSTTNSSTPRISTYNANSSPSISSTSTPDSSNPRTNISIFSNPECSTTCGDSTEGCGSDCEVNIGGSSEGNDTGRATEGGGVA
ncbi:unnamed protein product [Closterium sp. NIES-54]